MQFGSLYRWLRACIFVAAMGICTLASTAQAFDARHYKIEAAFLYNFLNYITWPGYNAPEELKEPIICLENDDAMASYLGYVQQKMQEQRTLHIRTVTEGKALDGCHMIFLRRPIAKSYMLRYLQSGILVITEPDDPLDRGGVIELGSEDERLTVSIDNSLLSQHGFRVSSRLLNLAEQVR